MKNVILLLLCFITTNSCKQEYKLIEKDHKTVNLFDTIINLSDSRKLYYKKHKTTINSKGLFYDGYLINDKDDTLARYPENYSEGWINLSPNKRFLITDNIIHGYVHKNEIDSILHENYHCVLINLKNGKVINSFQSNCSGEWNEKNQWVVGDDIIFNSKRFKE